MKKKNANKFINYGFHMIVERSKLNSRNKLKLPVKWLEITNRYS